MKRVTGKEGIIEELDSKTLRENYKLLDGEDIPTLQEVFDLNKERETIVIELKVYKDNWVNIAKRLMDFLSQVKDTSKVTLISFDPRALALCDGKKFTRGFLVCKERKDMIILEKSLNIWISKILCWMIKRLSNTEKRRNSKYLDYKR